MIIINIHSTYHVKTIKQFRGIYWKIFNVREIPLKLTRIHLINNYVKLTKNYGSLIILHIYQQ